MEEIIPGCLFDNFAGIHDSDALRHLGNDSQIMGDQ